MLLVLISLCPFLFLSTRLTFNPHYFLLPSFLHQHILFTKLSVHQGLYKVSTPHASLLPPVPGCLLMGACPRKLSVPRSCTPPPSRPGCSTWRGCPLLHCQWSAIPSPAFCLGLTHLLPFVLTWTIWRGEGWILGVLEESDGLPVLWKSSQHTAGKSYTPQNWQTGADSAACFLSVTPFPVKDASKGYIFTLCCFFPLH